MVVDTAPVSKISWKDKLWERKGTGSLDCSMISDGSTDVDLKFEEGDILRSIINGIPTIDFSKRIKKVLVKDMETTAIVKLLGRNIGYGVLFNQITSHWKPSQPFRLMDMENGYYLGFLYKKQILEEIGSLVGKVAKFNIKIDSGARGKLARMAVFVDLEKPLTSQVLVNGRMQRVEFEALPAVCFTCGRYVHLKNLCPFSLTGRNTDGGLGGVSETVAKGSAPATSEEAFGPWMIVERKAGRNQADNHNQKEKITEEISNVSRFAALEKDSARLDREHSVSMEFRSLCQSIENRPKKLTVANDKIGHGSNFVKQGLPISLRPDVDFQAATPPLHFNPTFEWPFETAVDLNAEVLDPK
ncbi:hypothetical protein Goklo_017415 [Gossypium klotzschianum]|uniref:DUF4283 domain-containing protein n=1 Tax=Gossypium klotzschianum TaxID=34286 RepID=A0A7J8UHI3_9ROSI|nr:hypothetical protein [Gossypium klotzschianum]